jgi:hypothetical protein
MKYVLFISITLLFSCQAKDQLNAEKTAKAACGTETPLQDLPWLKAQVEKAAVPSDYCTPYQVIQGKYQNKVVFIIPVTGALCDTCRGNMVYDCDGNVVLTCKPEEEEKITDQQVIWSKK